MYSLERPNYSQIDLETAIERIEQLEEALGLGFQMHPRYGLSAAHERVLGLLVASPGVATRERMFTALYGMRDDGGPDQKIFDVYISQIRKKLTPHGVNISTVWGRGWFMEAEDKAKVRAMQLPPEGDER